MNESTNSGRRPTQVESFCKFNQRFSAQKGLSNRVRGGGWKTDCLRLAHSSINAGALATIFFSFYSGNCSRKENTSPLCHWRRELGRARHLVQCARFAKWGQARLTWLVVGLLRYSLWSNNGQGQENYAWCNFYTLVTRKQLEITPHIDLFLEPPAACSFESRSMCEVISNRFWAIV